MNTLSCETLMSIRLYVPPPMNDRPAQRGTPQTATVSLGLGKLDASKAAVLAAYIQVPGLQNAVPASAVSPKVVLCSLLGFSV